MQEHVIPALKGRSIASICTSEVQAWVKGLSDRLSPGTVEAVFRGFASVCRSAVHDRLIAFNPCEGIKLPKKEVHRVVPLETAEVRALIDAMPDRYRVAAVVGDGAGLRQGEIFGLTVDRLDFPRRTLTVDRQLLTVSKQRSVAPRISVLGGLLVPLVVAKAPSRNRWSFGVFLASVGPAAGPSERRTRPYQERDPLKLRLRVEAMGLEPTNLLTASRFSVVRSRWGSSA